jgi:DNA-binding SARP family transcriptional activator/WD40 repeat protein
VALQIRVLGRVDALVDGQALPLRGSKQRAVLAMLALRANRTVSAEALTDGLWAERPPQSAAKMVQSYVSRLRSALAADGAGASIVTHGRGYELKVSAEAVDALCFERLIGRARREADLGVPDGAAKGALELWRGAPLADVASEPFAGPEIRRLEELYLRALELSVDAELAAGRHGEAIARLEALLAEHPLNERFYAQQMLALYRAGRQSEALAAYREARGRLSEEIGVEPGPELQRLQEQILAHDPALAAPALPAELPPQLEGGSPLLAGRERELGWLRERWAQARAGRVVCALVWGQAGIGKTRLAAELAAELRRAGATVLYAPSSGAPYAALDAISNADESERPTLLVLDDADDAPPGVLEAATALAAKPRPEALLILALHQDQRGPPALADLARAAASRPLALDRLGVEAVAEIAALYAPADGVAIPIERLIAESAGVPLRVHRAASAWAQRRARERLEARVGKTAGERSDLRSAQAELVGSVADLQVARQRTHLYLVSEPPDPSAPEVCPFRGLAPFEAAQAEYFFGRERLVAALVARLVGSTLLAVFGPSGSGKSSLLRAGLLPALASGVLPGSDRWRQVLIRPGAHPLETLRRALARIAPAAGDRDGDDPLAAALGSLAPDERLILAVDQFEELFTACREEEERAAFVEALAAAADPDQRLVVVLAIRAEFYGRCADYRDLSAQISANQLLVGPMTREELRRAIELPAQRAGLRVELALVSELVDDVADQPGGLPLLSTALLELWQERSARTLRRASYAASGGVSGAVARLAERAYRRLTESQRERARAILLRLADAEEAAVVRRRVALAELETERDPEAAAALAVLTESRLLTVDEDAVEVAHEALLREWPRLRDWLADDAEGRRLHQHLIHASAEWEASRRDQAELYRGARLASAHDWAASHERELNQLELDFLEESRAASEREGERQRRTNRRLRTLLAGVAVLLALALVAGVIALSERQGARSAATVADSQRLGAQALDEERLDQALMLANTGVALDDSLATRSNLLSTLLRAPAALGVLNGDGSPGQRVALSPNGDTLALGDGDGTVILFDTETRERIADHQAPAEPWSLAFSPRGDSLAIVGSNTIEHLAYLQIVDPSTLRVRTSVSLGSHPGAPGSAYYPTAVYAPDGRSLIVSYSTGDVDFTVPVFLRRFDVRSGSPIGPAVPVAPRSSKIPLRATADGRLLVSTATGKATYAIDAETLRVVDRYPVAAGSTAISPDGRTLAFEKSGSGLIRLLDLASGRARSLADPQGDVGVGAFSPDGRTLSTWADDGSVSLWDVDTGARARPAPGAVDPTETFEGFVPAGGSQVFSPDARTLYTAFSDSSVWIWDVAGDRRLIRPFRTDNDSFQFPPPTFAISPDGRTLAVSSEDGRVDLIDAETLRRTAGFEPFPGRSVLAIEYSPDGQRLAVAGGGGGVGLFDAGSGKRVGPLLSKPRDRWPRSEQVLAFGPGSSLAAASTGRQSANATTTPGIVRTWNLDGSTLIRRPLRLGHRVLGLAFSPGGSQIAIATGGDDQQADFEVRALPGGERLATLPSDGPVPTAEGVSVAFSPDGRLLAGGGVENDLLLWTTDGWRQVGRLPAAGGFGMAFSPDGSTLATSPGEAVGLWDVGSQQPIGSPLPLSVSSDAYVATGFAPDGAHLFAVSDSGTAIRFDVDPEVWAQHACSVAGGDLTPEQWEQVVPQQDYVSVCH